MTNRIYNILFHTHTVSGLVISVALYVIFFAGSMSFFRDDIVAWQRNEPIGEATVMTYDFERILDTLEARYGDLYGRNISIRQVYQERNLMISLKPSQDSLASEKAKKAVFTYLDTQGFDENTYLSGYNLGEFLYRLHFFAQIPYPYGYLLSGFVAFFFLFAIITGIIVHWKKIIPNFYLFRPGAKLKTLWTDAHTALGVIGLPFQFVFAVSGAVLIIGSIVMMAPASAILYKNDRIAMRDELTKQLPHVEFTNERLETYARVNDLVNSVRMIWGNALLSKIEIDNYADVGMRVTVMSQPLQHDRLLGMGRMAFDGATGEVLHEEHPQDAPGYVFGADRVLRKLHFGDFGGYGIRIIYFALGMATCFVILSGVLIWVEARDKKNVEPWKRKSNAWIASIFIAIALSMYPVTAMAFAAVKLFPEVDQPMSFIYKIYFFPWLVFSILFSLKKDNYFATRYLLITGSIIGFIVPIVNGLVTGQWIWKTLHPEQLQLFVVDMFWLSTSLVTLFVVLKMKREKNTIKTTKATNRPISMTSITS